jgi:hypothetical protein
MLRFTLTLIAALALCAAAQAQTAPKGWKVEASANAWVATSADHVRLAFYPAAKSKAAFVFWFQDEGLRHAFAYGRTVGNEAQAVSTMDPDAGRLMAQSRTLLDATGAQVAVLSYAWDAPQGRQLAQIVMPVAAAQGPACNAAFAELTKAYKSGFAYIAAP